MATFADLDIRFHLSQGPDHRLLAVQTSAVRQVENLSTCFHLPPDRRHRPVVDPGLSCHAPVTRFWSLPQCPGDHLSHLGLGQVPTIEIDRQTQVSPLFWGQASDVDRRNLPDPEFIGDLCPQFAIDYFARGVVYQDRDLDAPETNVVTQTVEEIGREWRQFDDRLVTRFLAAWRDRGSRCGTCCGHCLLLRSTETWGLLDIYRTWSH